MARHTYDLGAAEAQIDTPHGRRTHVRREELPLLTGISVAALSIEPGCFREPHWHANANELAYCKSGQMLVTVFTNYNGHDRFTIGPGEMFYIPSGALHTLENVGEQPVEAVVAFSHESPEDFGISGAVGMLSDNVMGNTWELPADSLTARRHSPEDIGFGATDGAQHVVGADGYPNHLKYALEASAAQLDTEHGSARMAKQAFWPALDGIAMYSLRIAGVGMREPHWHPTHGELGCVQSGRARMSIRDPDGSVDTYELGPGDVYFVPAAYPHHIENLEGEETHFLVFFDREVVFDIGYTGAISALPRRIVAPSLGLPEADLPELPEVPADLLVVGKVNPVDP